VQRLPIAAAVLNSCCGRCCGHDSSTLRWHPAVAPCSGTSTQAPKRTPLRQQNASAAPFSGTLQLHPAPEQHPSPKAQHSDSSTLQRHYLGKNHEK